VEIIVLCYFAIVLSIVSKRAIAETTDN